MPYKAQYINYQKQLGYLDYDLILTDIDGVLEDQRIHRSFNLEKTTVDQDFMDKDAASVINSLGFVQPLLEVGVDLPEGVSLEDVNQQDGN